MNKKASMELGVNAIIVLIIALAILGLAMSFITNMFKRGTIITGTIIDNTQMPIHADSGEPLKVETRDLSVKANSDNTQLKVSVYNNGNFDAENDFVKLWLDCYNMKTDLPEDKLLIKAPSQKIPLGSDVGYGAIVVAEKGTESGTYPCSVIASIESTIENAVNDPNAVSGQLYITVRA
ncbi:MAG TPA: hypothetical protein VJ461_00505 [Candidatus Nanoarchaeia archaeon]|nr:hypothetical protein [Candidatus Nanoarchaeia archaeon]